ncbi:hypothetical protein, partial [Caulobacter sp. 17J65-9]|uniref:hypothetical protein n=1 Tax=Caulobacter sp. 17J65-9 TaxID=2709382 RepID=UPI0013C67449
MTALVRTGLALCVLLLSVAAVAHAETTDGQRVETSATAAAPFGRDDLMLFEVEAAGQPLSDSFEGYAARGGVWLPLGTLARLLDLAVVVVPPERRAEGWVMDRARTVSLDLRSGRATANGRDFSVSAAEAVLFDDDIYVRTDLVEKLLPVGAEADLSGLKLTLTPKEALPFQQRLAREQRRDGLGVTGAPAETVMRVTTPYALATAPAVELVLDAGWSNREPELVGRYDLRLAGDLARAGYQVNAGSDDDGRLSYVRMLFERTDVDGRATGRPWGVTRAAVGDAYSPQTSLGARSAGGRGGFFTTAPLEAADVFDGLDLRGDLPPGYEVELYVNDVLRGSQSAPVAGRYEFNDVPLAFGGNVLRLVFYGPRGERREEVRRINYGQGRTPKGRLYASFGAVQQNVPVVELDSVGGPGDPGYGRWRFAGTLDYGLTSNLSVSAGFAQYTPALDDTRQLVSGGLRTSFDGFALQADLAGDSTGATAAALGAAGRPFGVSLVARHAEYAGGFLDETHPRGALPGVTPLRRSTELRVDALAHVFFKDLAVPVSADARRDESVDGTAFLQAGLRVSTAVAGWYWSSGWSYQHDGALAEPDRLAGAWDISQLSADGWRLRGGLTYEVLPERRLSTAFVNADWEVADRSALRLGVAHSFGETPDTTVSAAQTWRLSTMDLSLTGAYGVRDGDVRVGVQLALGAWPDPWGRRYVAARPGVASGGDLALLAFVDRNHDGARQPGEPALPDLKLEGGQRPTATDADGRVALVGLGVAPRARLRVPADSLGDPYLAAPAEVIEFAPRAGRTT